MREVRARHWTCGTEVVERVPDGYDLSEGLVLVCPRCREPWWEYPDPAQLAGPGAAGHGFSRLWLGLVLGAAVAAILALSLTDRRDPPPRPGLPATIGGPGYTIPRPAGWTASRSAQQLTLIAPAGQASVRVSVSRAADVPLREAARLAGRGLAGPGSGPVRGPVDATLDGRRALALTVAAGGARRELTLLDAVGRRYSIELRTAAGAPPSVAAAAAAARRSFRVLP